MVKGIIKSAIVHVAVFTVILQIHAFTERQNIDKLVLSATDTSSDLIEATLPTVYAEIEPEIFFDDDITNSNIEDPVAGSDMLALDTDSDGLTDHEERAIYQTNWLDPDTDGDGYDDGLEVTNGYSPKQSGMTMNEADTDNDGLNDAWEIALGTNLMVRDTDGDGILDGTEVYEGFSPTSTEPIVLDKQIVVNDKELNLKFYIAGVEMLDIPVSTGKPSTPTPLGEFEILDKVPVKWYGGPGFDFSYPNTKWNLHFTTDYWRYWIHGAYWHDKFGKSGVSGGCINVRYEDMEDLYNFASLGTKVSVH